MSRQWIEERDGQEFTVTRLPQDRRLEPGRTRKRQLFAALPAATKAEHIRSRVRKAKKRKRRKQAGS